MSRMDIYLASSPEAALVRWPFRVLAAVLVVAFLGTLVTGAYLVVEHHSVRAVLLTVVVLPLAALVCRSAGHAALVGRVLSNLFWPFASGRVAFVWVFLAFIIIRFVIRDA